MRSKPDTIDKTAGDSPTHAPESGEPLETGPKSVRTSMTDQSGLKSKPVGTDSPRTRRAGDRNAAPD
jgi:hypothetical protein